MVCNHSLLYALWIGFTPSHLGGHCGRSLSRTLHIYFMSPSLTQLDLVSVPELFWLKIHTAGKQFLTMFSFKGSCIGNMPLRQHLPPPAWMPNSTEGEMGKNPWVHAAGIHLDRNLSVGDLTQWNWRQWESPIRNPSRSPVLGSEMGKQSSSVGHQSSARP